MELEFDYPEPGASENDITEFRISAKFKLISEENHNGFITIDGVYDVNDNMKNVEFSLESASEYNKYACYSDFKSKLKIIKDGMEEELRKINSVYNDLEKLSIDEFEKKYFSMSESIEEELSREYFDKLDNIILSSDEDNNNDELNKLFDKLTGSTNEQLLDLWKTQDWNNTKMYNDSISIYQYYLSQELLYRDISIPE